MVKIKEAIQQIKARIDTISYARDVLGFPVSKDGDRCQGLEQSNKSNDSLAFSKDGWYDFHLKEGGDVIALAQKVKFKIMTGFKRQKHMQMILKDTIKT